MTGPPTPAVRVTVSVTDAAVSSTAAVALAKTTRPGASTVKVAAALVPPPGAGLKTVTEAGPAVATSLAGMSARSSVGPTTVVSRATPFHRTTDPGTKWLPVTVSVRPAPAASVRVGLIALSEGTGLRTDKLTPF